MLKQQPIDLTKNIISILLKRGMKQQFKQVLINENGKASTTIVTKFGIIKLEHTGVVSKSIPEGVTDAPVPVVATDWVFDGGYITGKAFHYDTIPREQAIMLAGSANPDRAVDVIKLSNLEKVLTSENTRVVIKDRDLYWAPMTRDKTNAADAVWLNLYQTPGNLCFAVSAFFKEIFELLSDSGLDLSTISVGFMQSPTILVVMKIPSLHLSMSIIPSLFGKDPYYYKTGNNTYEVKAYNTFLYTLNKLEEKDMITIDDLKKVGKKNEEENVNKEETAVQPEESTAEVQPPVAPVPEPVEEPAEVPGSVEEQPAEEQRSVEEQLTQFVDELEQTSTIIKGIGKALKGVLKQYKKEQKAVKPADDTKVKELEEKVAKLQKALKALTD